MSDSTGSDNLEGASLSFSIPGVLDNSTWSSLSFKEKYIHITQTPPRQVAFFEEHLPIFIIFTLPSTYSTNDTKFDSWMKNIEDSTVSLDHLIVGKQPLPLRQKDPSNSNEHTRILHSETLDCKGLLGSMIDDKDGSLVVIWFSNIEILYPRTRLENPNIVLTTHITFPVHSIEKDLSLQLADISSDHESFLEEFVPAYSKNILAPLSEGLDQEPSDSSAFMPASRLTGKRYISYQQELEQSVTSKLKQAQVQRESDDAKSNLTTSISLPVVPILSMKLRSTKAAGINDTLISTLDIEPSDLFIIHNLKVIVKSINVNLIGGDVKQFSHSQLPISIGTGDAASFLYYLSNNDFLPQQLSSNSISEEYNSRNRPVKIKVDVIPLISAENENEFENDSSLNSLGPTVSISWSTTTDFGIIAPPTNSSLKTSSHRHSNPNVPPRLASSLSILKHLKSSMSSLTFNVPRSSSTKNVLTKLALSFSGTTTVKIGETFKWKIFAINKLNSARKLSLYIQPKDQFEKILPKITESNLPVIDNLMLKNIYKNSSLPLPGIICLGNDIRIGPLGPFSSYETEITLLALNVGTFSLEGVRVIDLASGDSFDCGRLLEVVVRD